MRVIAGKYKGHPVKFPKSDLVRPTTDRTKESLFNYLSNQIDFDKISMCDIYAGSGSLGLEALSRGAGKVVFVEKNYPVYKTLIENVNRIDKEKLCLVLKMDAVRFSGWTTEQFDLIIADPPFFKDDIYTVAQNIKANKLCKKEGIFLIERSIQTKEKDIINFGVEPFKKIGDSLIYRIS